VTKGNTESGPQGDSMLLLLAALLVGAPNPSANRSAIAFAAWSSFAHGAVMAVMAVHLANERRDLLIAAAVFGIIGAALIALAPARQLGERAAAAGA